MNSGAVAQAGTDRWTRICILIADPDTSLLAVYRELLRNDFEVVTAPSGLECVARLRERPPDVLVLEPQLPWGGGDGVLAMMRDVPHLADVPVMILTACRDRRVLESVASYRISDYRVKPLPPVQLAARARAVLDRRKVRAAAENDRLETWNERRGEAAAVEQQHSRRNV